MNTYSNDLFELIRSLSKSEQRYFKLFSALHKGCKTNTKLFDAIVKQGRRKNPKYDEEKIKKEFRQEHFISYLSQAKNYLYDQILKSLEAYRSSTDSELRSLLNQAEILLERGLYKRCKLVLLKLDKEAVKHEKYAYAFEAAILSNQLILKMPANQRTENEMRTNADNSRNYLKKIENIAGYSHLQTQMNYLILQSGRLVRNKKELKKWDAIMKNPLLHDESQAITLNSKLHMYLGLNFYYNVTDDLEKTYQFCYKIVQLFESNPDLLTENINKYVTFLINLLVSYARKNMHNELYNGIQKLKNISATCKIKLPFQLEAKIFEYSYSLELDYYLITGQFQKIDTVAHDIEKGLIKYSGENGRSSVMLCLGIAHLFLINGNYKKSLIWINKILLDNRLLNSGDDRIYFFCIIRLILYYELKYTNELPYMLKSTYRLFVKKKKMYKVEESILNFLKKSLKMPDQKELTLAYTELKESISGIIKDPSEKKVIEYFDFISWLESKIENRSFSDILKSKISKNGY